MYIRYLKRTLDIFIAFFGIVILSPILIIISVVVFINDPGPVMFRQKRVGRNKRHFLMLKFRSMKMSAPHDTPTHKLKDPEQHITKVGRFLRRLSLDELPQLFNILIGQISVVGPRPALWNQYDLIAERDKYGANDIRPGLTGWAQINGRDELPIPVKAKLDGEYVEKMSFLFDIKCFWGTIIKVFRQDGVCEGESTKSEQDEERSDECRKEYITK